MLLRVLQDAGIELSQLHHAFLRRGQYADLHDYLLAIESVWGTEVGLELLRQIRSDDTFTYSAKADVAFRDVPDAYSAEAFLLAIPEPDFLTSLEAGLGMSTNPYARVSLPNAVNRICSQRGVPYRLEGHSSQARFRLDWRRGRERAGAAAGALGP